LPTPYLWLEASCSWLESDVCEILLDYGFINANNDGVTFVKNDRSVSKILLSIHVDDGLAVCSDETMYKEFIAAMRKDFDLSDSGELKRYLSGKVEQDRKNVIVRLCQDSIAMMCSNDSR